MVSSTIDHMVAVTVFLAATLLFIGLFNQTISTAVTYQRHRALATKASDLLDGILLSPGIPINWGQTDVIPTGFGVQDPEFTQYQISPYSLMRLRSSVGEPVNYNGTWYSNVTMGQRNFMLVPYNLALNYSTATRLLGINNTYGFQLTLTPIVTVSIQETSPSPLTIKVKADGIGFPLSYATISYCFLKVTGGQSSPSYDILFNTTTADNTGSVNINIPNVGQYDSYALVVYAREGGLVGVGYHERTFDAGRYVIPFIDSFDEGQVLLVHSYNVHDFGPPSSAVFYNATYVVMTEDFTLREMPISNETGKVVYGQGTEQQYEYITIPTHNPGILVITYNSNNGVGVVMMPWGISSLAFPVSFGGDASQQEWVATDMRQVTVGGIAYQAQIAVWSLEGYQVNG